MNKERFFQILKAREVPEYWRERFYLQIKDGPPYLSEIMSFDEVTEQNVHEALDALLSTGVKFK